MTNHPQTGGSFVRDAKTGALTPAGAAKPAKPVPAEEAAPAEPSKKEGK